MMSIFTCRIALIWIRIYLKLYDNDLVTPLPTSMDNNVIYKYMHKLYFY